ncbi:MAG: T9SS type A sorting domain-containing protein [Candidatus Goldiibacteriota bacterium]
MKKTIIFLIFLIIAAGTAYAEVSDVAITSVSPASPAAGDLVTVDFTYSNAANPHNSNYFCAAVSVYQTIQGSNTQGQTFKVNENGINVGNTGEGDAAVDGGYNMNDGDGSAAKSGSFTFNIPSTLEGGTYYIVIGGRQDWVDTGSALPASEDYYEINIPLPPPECTISKIAEGTSVQPGDYILYSIDYSYINGTNLVITDTVPDYCTLVEQSPGGVSSGAASGSTLTWTHPDSLSGRVRGRVWFFVEVDTTAPVGAVIDNTAQWTMDEIPEGGASNQASVVIDPPFELVKSQSVDSAQEGDTITYSFDFDISGLSLKSYDSFDENIDGFFSTGGTFEWAADADGGGYLKSPTQGAGNYPHFLRNEPADFCTGMIIADVWIGDELNAGSDNWDALIVFRDNGLAGTNGRAYGAGISADGIPHSVYLQEVNPDYNVRAGSNAITVSSMSWYTIKILVTNAGSGEVNVKIKAWPRGTSEPGVWHINWTDTDGSVPACGYAGFQGHESNPNLYDNLKIFQPSLAAYDAYLSDPIPSQITYIGGTGTDGVHDGATESGGVVSWTFADEVVDYSGHVEWWGELTGCGQVENTGNFTPNSYSSSIDSNTVIMDVECAETPTITPTATITATPSATSTITPTATQTATPTATMTATFTPIIPVLSLSKSVEPDRAGEGDTVTYTIRAMNSGLIDAQNVNIWDTLPSKHIYLSGGSYDAGTDVVSFMSPLITVGSYQDFVFTAVLDSTITKDEVFYNTASADCDIAPDNFVSNRTDLAADVPDLELESITNYPNPFNEITTLVYTLTKSADVNIRFYTVSGEHVTTLENIEGIKGTNKTQWNGENDFFEKLSSGIYIYKITAVSGDEKVFAFNKLAILR